MGSGMSKVSSALNILQEDGIAELGKSASHFFRNRTEDRLIDFLISQSNPIDDDELINSVSKRSFDYTEQEKVNIENASKRALPDQIQSYIGEYNVRPSFVFEIENAILHEKRIVFNTNGRVIFNSLGNCGWLYKHRIQNLGSLSTTLKGLSGRPLLSQIKHPTKRIPRGFNLVRSGSYYHWVTEYLPHIRALKKYEREMGVTLPLLVEPEPPGWVVDYLSLLGLEDRIKPIPEKSVTVDTLVSPSHRLRIGSCFNPSTKDLKWVGQRYREVASVNSGSSSRRILISREDANPRRIINREELFQELSKLGFNKYTLTDHSIEDQIRLFANAECIVGMHGAGLTNAIFAKDTKIFEIIPGPWYWHDFNCMSDQLGFDYDFYRTDENGTVDSPGRDDDFYVEVDVVRERVESLLRD